MDSNSDTEVPTQIKRLGVIATLIAVGSVFFTVGVAASGPTDAVVNAMDQLVGPITNIGSILLFLYGLIQLIKAGVSEQSSRPLKKIGIAWGIALVLQSYDNIQDWLVGDVSTVVVDPTLVTTAITYIPF